ncbi:HAD family hydrolase, partial [Streptomyces sp. NPDC058964]|uniref:HAD family hydrolase n=1 Tax=Streptomyces sp. NPDC058964 TaxID=3346681 RepID=UPI0036CF18D6
MSTSKGRSHTGNDRAAVFDVDGTLVDTNHLHVVTWWEAFRRAGHVIPTHAIHRAVGLGSGDLVDHLLSRGEEQKADLAPGEAEMLSTAHKVLYAQYFERRCPRPGAAPRVPRRGAPRGRVGGGGGGRSGGFPGVGAPRPGRPGQRRLPAVDRGGTGVG